MALMFLLVIWQWYLLRGRSYATVTGKGYSPNITRLGPWRWVTFSFCILFFIVTVVLPVGQLAVGSFFQFFGFYSWDMLTLDHYRAVMQNKDFWRALVQHHAARSRWARRQRWCLGGVVRLRLRAARNGAAAG